ncbi:hypothetical protein DVH05_027017 [Phytophthora capsici]|nr:hypothetical protein DVH05_027017 [Phytophthora capsici]
MQTSLPAFVEDPALSSASPKLLSLPMVIPATTLVSVKPLSLPTVVEESAKVTDSVQPLMASPESEKYLPRADGVSFQFQSEAFRLRIQAKISELMLSASTETCNGTNALLAKKTLKYRRVLERRPFASAVEC